MYRKPGTGVPTSRRGEKSRDLREAEWDIKGRNGIGEIYLKGIKLIVTTEEMEQHASQE